MYLTTRYIQLGVMGNLDEAFVLRQEALDLCPSGHPYRFAPLIGFAVCLSIRFNQLGRIEDLDESITCGRETLKLCPLGHPGRWESLNVLAVSLSTRNDQLGMMENLDEAIVLSREALALCPSGHPSRSDSLINLAEYLSARYQQLGEMKDLIEGIALGQEALELCPCGHPSRAVSLNCLARNLSNRYNRLGKMKDMDEAIVLGREALTFWPPERPNRWKPLTGLAARLTDRYFRLGVIDDLDEAIFLNREALELCPPENPNRFVPLNALAADLSTLYSLFREMKDLDEAIILGREELSLRPPGHPDRSHSLNNLALRLTSRYKRVDMIQDLNDAIVFGQEALEFLPPAHLNRSIALNNLASHFALRHDRLKESKDLDQAISLNREALELCPSGNPDRSYALLCLTSTLYDRFTRIGDVNDQDELFSLYAELDVLQTVSSIDLVAAKSWICAAERCQHPTTLAAYRTSLRLLVEHLVTLPLLPQNLDILKNKNHIFTSSLAVDAFSAYLRNHSPADAVELLEQGRGVFWNQLTRLRSPLDDVIASGQAGEKLADKFTALASRIRNMLNSPDTAEHDRAWRLNVRLQKVVTNIRGLPGLSRFLLPPLFSDLQQAASEGPVIIVNASQYSCDALVVLLNQDPVHIPLSITLEGVGMLSSRLRTLTQRIISMGVHQVTRELGRILRELWDDVVSPIVKFLQTLYPSRSRIWWCPTSEFSLLPLHAAGPYRKGQWNLADVYISSYTPTLTALIRARQHDALDSVAEEKHFVAIGQAEALGEDKLVSVGDELAAVARHVDGLATFTRIEGQEACISRVAEELGKNQWVHLACHGLSNSQLPFESAFALADGHLTIQHIIQYELKNSQFAYLSACHTTVGDEESPDEVIHLASAMQFAGFRSVVGTMWAVDDGEANKITSSFYKHMLDESGRLDHTRAALALNKTLRSADAPFDQRVLYIHIGA